MAKIIGMGGPKNINVSEEKIEEIIYLGQASHLKTREERKLQEG